MQAEDSCMQGRPWCCCCGEVPCPFYRKRQTPGRTKQQHEKDVRFEALLTVCPIMQSHLQPLPISRTLTQLCISAAPIAMPLGWREMEQLSMDGVGGGRTDIQCLHHCYFLCSDSGGRAMVYWQWFQPRCLKRELLNVPSIPHPPPLPLTLPSFHVHTN